MTKPRTKRSPSSTRHPKISEQTFSRIAPRAAAHMRGRKAGLREAVTLLLLNAEQCEKQMGGKGLKGFTGTICGGFASAILRVTAADLAKRIGDKDLEKLTRKRTKT